MIFRLEDFPAGWQEVLTSELNKPYMNDLADFIANERSQYKVFPDVQQVFSAFQKTDFNKVKAVILGQDPYHDEGQAHGLCFSVQPSIAPPPSLKNIFKELKSDLNIQIPDHGCLYSWAAQGVLLLNTCLTVRAHQANSHAGKGWEIFTDRVIELLAKERKNIVFILWGSPAQKKLLNTDLSNHLVLQSPHPSPLSAYRGFLGSKPFSKTNAYLKEHSIEEINWELPVKE